MGLDMYLTRKQKGFDFNGDIGYWRKANAIHNWFVKNIQNGIDECQESLVTKDDLESLLEVCQNVLDTVKLADGKVIVNQEEIAALLPTIRGYFFGSTDYDKYYIEDIKDTINILRTALKETNFDEEEIYYQASW